MLILSLCGIVVGVVLLMLNSYGRGAEKKGTKLTKLLYASGLLVLTISLFFFYDATCKKQMRRRLSEPILTEAPLHGYDILSKKSLVSRTGRIRYFIDIKDILPGQRKLKNVEVTKEIYEKVEELKKKAPVMTLDWTKRHGLKTVSIFYLRILYNGV